MQKYLLLILIITAHCFAGISFKNEKITARIIACDTLELQGIYYFENSDSIPACNTIYYPFPVDSVLSYPFFISVKKLSDNKKIRFVKKQEGVIWKQECASRSIDSVIVVYRQKAAFKKGRYILTTTKYWKKALEKAEFTVITPSDVTLSYWSFQTDSVYSRNSHVYYHAQKKNVIPESDMLLEWECE